jgi:hypothetical protein
MLRGATDTKTRIETRTHIQVMTQALGHDLTTTIANNMKRANSTAVPGKRNAQRTIAMKRFQHIVHVGQAIQDVNRGSRHAGRVGAPSRILLEAVLEGTALHEWEHQLHVVAFVVVDAADEGQQTWMGISIDAQ